FFSSRRRHTRSKRDWSSDVCSSDLHTDPSRIFRCACPYFMFSRHHIEIDPLSVSSCHHALGTENIPIVISALKLLQDIRDLLLRISMDRLTSPARKHFIRVMMSCMIMMIVTAAAVVVMMMLVIVVVMVVLVVMVFMVVMVLVIMIVVVVVLMLMMVLMVMTAALAVFVMFTALGTDHLRQKFLFQR